MIVSKRGDKAQTHRAFIDRIENMLSHKSVLTPTAADLYLISYYNSVVDSRICVSFLPMSLGA